MCFSLCAYINPTRMTAELIYLQGHRERDRCCQDVSKIQKMEKACRLVNHFDSPDRAETQCLQTRNPGREGAAFPHRTQEGPRNCSHWLPRGGSGSKQEDPFTFCKISSWTLSVPSPTLCNQVTYSLSSAAPLWGG